MRIMLAAVPAFVLLLSSQAHAVTQAQAEKIANDYLSSLPPADVSYEASKTVIGDLDGDGWEDLVIGGSPRR